MSDISKDNVEMLANNLADFYKMEAEAQALRAQQARIEELEARLSDSTDSLVTVTKKLAKAEAALEQFNSTRKETP